MTDVPESDVEAGEGRPRGALALVGAWKAVGDRTIDRIVESVYAARASDPARAVSLEEQAIVPLDTDVLSDLLERARVAPRIAWIGRFEPEPGCCFRAPKSPGPR